MLGALGDEGGALDDVLAGGAALGNSADILASDRRCLDRLSSGWWKRSAPRSGGGRWIRRRHARLASRFQHGCWHERSATGSGHGATRFADGFDSTAVATSVARVISIQLDRRLAPSVRRLRAIQRCYETELRRNPSLRRQGDRPVHHRGARHASATLARPRTPPEVQRLRTASSAPCDASDSTPDPRVAASASAIPSCSRLRTERADPRRRRPRSSPPGALPHVGKAPSPADLGGPSEARSVARD